MFRTLTGHVYFSWRRWRFLWGGGTHKQSMHSIKGWGRVISIFFRKPHIISYSHPIHIPIEFRELPNQMATLTPPRVQSAGWRPAISQSKNSYCISSHVNRPKYKAPRLYIWFEISRTPRKSFIFGQKNHKILGKIKMPKIFFYASRQN